MLVYIDRFLEAFDTANAIYNESDVRTVHLETLGCKLNQADTQAIAKRFVERGYRIVGEHENADVFVLNTCTVTHVADRKSRQAARAAKRRNPESMIVVTGCYAERAPGDLREMPEVDLVIGNSDKSTLVRIVEDATSEPDTACSIGDDQSLSPVLKLRSRAMVKIQEGCDQVCAYCIVPKVRGRERSIPVEEIVATTNAYAAAGCREVVLTGTQLGSYGFDLPDMDIVGLLKTLLAETDLPRIRISSLQPQDISDELLDLWSDSRLCPHFHVPLQSGSNAVLGRMRRRYTSAQFVDTVDRIRDVVPDVSVTADVIVGFPGETDRDFVNTVTACKDAALAALHVFPYSIRPGTSAAHFDAQIDPTVKSERASELMSVARELSHCFRSRFLRSSRQVLWERASGAGAEQAAWSGLTENYIRVRVKSSRNLANLITGATLTSLNGEWVDAEIVGLPPGPDDLVTSAS